MSWANGHNFISVLNNLVGDLFRKANRNFNAGGTRKIFEKREKKSLKFVRISADKNT